MLFNDNMSVIKCKCYYTTRKYICQHGKVGLILSPKLCCNVISIISIYLNNFFIFLQSGSNYFA